jgi:hypothetical protein
MSNPGGATISVEQLKARYVGTGAFVWMLAMMMMMMTKDNTTCTY